MDLMRQGSGVWKSFRDGDFEEEDVWEVLREKKDSNSKIGASVESSFSVPRNLPSAARMIPRTETISGSSSNNSSNETKLVQQQSAPVNITDWSKISTKKSKKASKNTNSWLDYDDNEEEEDDDEKYNNGVLNEDSDEENDLYYKLPPHELLARRLARSQISSFSVFEGVGRTLKGRDLSKVRNGVLTKTGFLE